MALKAQIDSDIIVAMKAKDQVSLRALRAIKAAIIIAQTAEGATENLSEAQETQLLTKQAKQRKDSIEQFEKNGRNDLAIGEKEELSVIEKYLPKQLSGEELEKIIKEIIAETNAKSPADLGKVMKIASPCFAGIADGKLVSEIVKKLLS